MNKQYILSSTKRFWWAYCIAIVLPLCVLIPLFSSLNNPSKDESIHFCYIGNSDIPDSLEADLLSKINEKEQSVLQVNIENVRYSTDYMLVNTLLTRVENQQTDIFIFDIIPESIDPSLYFQLTNYSYQSNESELHYEISLEKTYYLPSQLGAQDNMTAFISKAASNSNIEIIYSALEILK